MGIEKYSYNDGQSNKFSYTDITYQKMVEKMSEIFANDSRFKNYNESDIAPMVLELFAGMTDMINYNIERAAEESYFSTLSRYRSASKLAGDLGYDIKRPIPAKANIKFILQGTSTLRSGSGDSDFERNKLIFIPKHTDFIFNGTKFVLAEDITYILSDFEMAQLKKGYTIEIDIIKSPNGSKLAPTLIQGEIKVIEFKGSENDTNFTVDGDGKTFQTYYIEDPTFSNFYGEYDIFNGVTTLVGVGAYYAEAMSQDKLYNIRRKSLIDTRTLQYRHIEDVEFYKSNVDKYNYVNTEKKLYRDVWIRTSAEVGNGQGVEIRFGDGITTARGPLTKDESVFVQYLSTKGSDANKNGVQNKLINITDTHNNLVNIKPYVNIKAQLTSNIIGGGDIEPIQSIRNSAPGVFQTFDRLVTKKDYNEYLHTLTSPINVKNGYAWGEQDELISNNYHNDLPKDISNFAAIRKLFNVVLYTVLGSLYQKEEQLDGTYITKPVTNMFNILLDSYNGNYIYPSQNYITIMAQKEVVKQLKFKNQLFDGTLPIYDFKFNIEFAPMNSIRQNNFIDFFNTFVYPRFYNISGDPMDPTDEEDATVRFCGLPAILNFNLDNPDSDIIEPIVTNENDKNSVIRFGESLKIDITVPATDDGMRQLYSPNGITLDLNRDPYNFDILKQAGNWDGSWNGSYDVYPVVRVIGPNNVIPLTQNDNGTNRVYVGSGYEAITYNYAYQLWERIIETTWDANVIPVGYHSSTIQHNIGSINYTPWKEEFYSYTPWGYVTQEIEDSLNNQIRYNITSIDFTDPELDVNTLTTNFRYIGTFKFVDLVPNLEHETQEVTDWYDQPKYIDSMIEHMITPNFGKNLNNKLNPKGIEIYPSYQNGVYDYEFPLVKPGTFITRSDGKIFIEDKAELLKMVDIILDTTAYPFKWFNWDSANSKWVWDNQAGPNTDPTFELKDFNLFSDWSEKDVLYGFCMKTVGGVDYFMNSDDIDLLVETLYLIRSEIDDAITTQVNYRSGETFSNSRGETIQIIGTYRNMTPTSADGSTMYTDYTEMQTEIKVNFDIVGDSIDAAKSWTDQDFPQWLTKDYGNDNIKYINADEANSDEESQSIINTYDGISLLYVYQDGLTNDFSKNNVKNLYDVRKEWISNPLGINELNFYGYYPINDVALPEDKYSDKITIVDSYLAQRQQLTVRSIYISPIIHQFQLYGNIYISPLTNIEVIRPKIQNAVYEFLDNNNDFNTHLYVSNLVEIIEKFPEVLNANLVLLPYNTVPKPLGQKYYFDIDSFNDTDFNHPIYSTLGTQEDKEKFQRIVLNSLAKYVDDHQLNMIKTDTVVGDIPFSNDIQKKAVYSIYDNEISTYKLSNGEYVSSSDTEDHYMYWQQMALASKVTERTFLNELMKTIIDECEAQNILSIDSVLITRTKQFFMLMAEIHNDFAPIIRYNMLNSYGDIAPEYKEDVIYTNGELERVKLRGGYSLKNEIAQVFLTAEIGYREA